MEQPPAWGRLVALHVWLFYVFVCVRTFYAYYCIIGAFLSECACVPLARHPERMCEQYARYRAYGAMFHKDQPTLF